MGGIVWGLQSSLVSMIKIQKDFLHRKDFTGYRYRRRDIDDAICLVYLLKEPQCELIGITTVCGEPEKRAAVADVICRTVGK